jgi:hypothetical protein
MYQKKIGLVHHEMNKLENTDACGADKEAIFQLE